MPRPRKSSSPDAVRGKLKPHDPFDLIRWLAFSQPDARKALTELVQNSLDAGARRVRVTRYRERGLAAITVLDDGCGVIPEMDRVEALRFLATNIGSSRKRALSPQQRLELMTQGQYGIGLLGFWSLGERLEMRSAVAGQRAHRLVLHRDSPQFEIEPLRGLLPLDETWTEVVVSGLHPHVETALAGRRIADYLGAELRGQLLARAVDLVYEDRVARGRAQKVTHVRPQRFDGDRLSGIDVVPVPGHPPLRLELYALQQGGLGGALRDADGEIGAARRTAGAAARNASAPATASAASTTSTASAASTSFTASTSSSEDLAGCIHVYAAGTLVAESFRELGGLGLDRAPWIDARLHGFVDFPALRVAPGSRRGLVMGPEAEAFAAALAGIEPDVLARLAELERVRDEQVEQSVVRELQRAFRDLVRQKPRYALPRMGEGALRAPGGAPEPGFGSDDVPGLPPRDHSAGDESAANAMDAANAANAAGAARTADGADGAGAEPATDAAATAAHGAQESLFPCGPLDHVVIVPAEVTVACGGARRVRAVARDARGGEAEGPLRFAWELDAHLGRIESGDRAAPGDAATDASPDSPAILVRGAEVPAQGWLVVTVVSGTLRARAEAPLQVVDQVTSGRSGEGIPAPVLVDERHGAWRSRWIDQRWEVNAGHRDYRAIANSPALKLRYLTLLFAKEVVLMSSGDPRLDGALEQLVEVQAFAERNLVRRGRRPRQPRADRTETE